jgi:pimeloyl-ACP methyl ester carboxylesterase
MSLPPSYGDKGITLPPNCTLSTPTILTWPTECLHFSPLTSTSSSSSGPIPHVLFVPGNPGTCLFYIDFLERIQRKHFPTHHIHAISYAGHGITPSTVSGDECTDFNVSNSLSGQAAHKVSFIQDTLSLTSDKSTLVLLGHSIGCHVISLFLPSLAIPVPNTFFLTPFIRLQPALASQAIPLQLVAASPLAVPRNILSLLNALLSSTSAVTKPLLKKSLRHLGGLTNANTLAVAIALAVTPSYFRNFITLGHEEITTIPPKPDVDSLRLVARCTTLHCLYAGGPDQWGPVNHMHDLADLMKTGELDKFGLLYEDSITHDFVQKDVMIDRVVEYVGNCVNRAPTSKL